MSSRNQVDITGYCGADSEVRYTTTNIAVAKVSVGENKRNGGTNWHRVFIMGKYAEKIAPFIKKGDHIQVVGRIEYRSWLDKNTNEKRYVTDIIAREVLFLSSKKEVETNASSNQAEIDESDFASIDPEVGF